MTSLSINMVHASLSYLRSFDNIRLIHSSFEINVERMQVVHGTNTNKSPK